MGKFVYHPNARDDVLGLGVLYPGPMRILAALFRQMEVDEKKFALLWEHGYGEFKSDDFNVLRWGKAHKAGAEIWRVKDLRLDREKIYLRTFYCSANNDLTVAHVLGIVKKQLPPQASEFDYDNLQSPTAARVMRAYGDIRNRT